MPNIIEITDFHAPELDPYARLTQNQLRNRLEPEKGIFIAESPKVIDRALDAGFELVQMARALVNDPAFVNKLREGDAATRSECDHRNYCIARMYSVDMKCCKHCGDLPRKIREELAKLP